MASCLQQQTFLSSQLTKSTATMMSSIPNLKLGEEMTSSTQQPDNIISIPMNLSSNMTSSNMTSLTPAVSSQPYTAASLDSIFSNGLSGQMEINKQLMECLTVALDEIRELRKQLAERSENSSPTNTPTPPLSEHITDATVRTSPSLHTVGNGTKIIKKEDNISPSPTSLFDTSMDWSVLQSIPEQGTTQRGKRCRSDKSHVPAACRSIVKNVYRELVRRNSINGFDLHQGQESAHNVTIYWQVIEHIKKTNASCSWGDVDMLYAIRTYWRSLRDDRQRELSGKKYNHRRMIIRREIMKRKLKSRQKAIALVTWVPELRDHVTETLSLDYMSSEEEDNTVECREGPRPRVVRKLPWESELMTKCKQGLDLEFRKICSARQLKATAHVYRRPDVISNRPKPVKCPQWASDPNWDPETLKQTNAMSLNFSETAPSMLPMKELSFHNNNVQNFSLLNPGQLQGVTLLSAGQVVTALHGFSTDNSNKILPQLQISTISAAVTATTSPEKPSNTSPIYTNLNNSVTPTQSILYPLTSLTALTSNITKDNTENSVDITMETTESSSMLNDKTIAQSVLQSLSDTDRKLVDSIVETLANSNPLVKEMNPLDVLLSLNNNSDISNLLTPQ